ncbi:MAG: hypothetical protein UGF83_08150 [Collinsella sp.]|nr:hypothetical protein [Collinsella sp.]
MKFEQSPPRWACQPISNEGAAVPSLAQYVNHTQKGGKIKRSQGRSGKTEKPDGKGESISKMIETAPQPLHQPRAKKQGNSGGVAGYNRRQKEKQP